MNPNTNTHTIALLEWILIVPVAVLAVLFFPIYVDAISTNQSSYTTQDVVQVTCAGAAGNLFIVYDITGNTNIGEFACDTPAEVSLSSEAGHTYAALEYDNNSSCNADDYYACKDESFIVGEVHFTVSDPSAPGGGGGVQSDTDTSGLGVAQYAPSISILAPLRGTIFSHLGTITYRATDLNDTGSAYDRERYGLPKNPVSLFYSDKIAEWDPSSPLIAPALKTPIAQNLPAVAEYSWEITDLVPGVFYRVIADVADAAGALAETVSDFFTVNFTAPTFIVRTDPPVTQGKDVVVSVDASEDLSTPPKVVVTQANGSPVTLLMSGSKTHYEGTYQVQKGHDGLAVITVSGSDIAGNVGTSIVSGGTFAVGLNPPPVPIVSSIRTGAVVAVATTTVSGTTRPDTTVELMVNGLDTYSAAPAKDGSFVIANVRLEKAHRGKNVLSVVARDQTGLASSAVPIEVTYNLPPTIALIVPQDDMVISSATTIIATSTDPNDDPLFYTYELIPAEEFVPGESATSTKNDWAPLIEATRSASYLWDSTEVEAGSYLLRVVADDGIVKTYSQPVSIAVKNTLPFIRFDDGRRTVTNSPFVKITGHVGTPDTISPQPAIKTLEYSSDNGKKWKSVDVTSEGSFSLHLSGLSEGVQATLWRVKDTRNLYGRARHSVVVDRTPPAPPELSAPRSGAVLGSESDEDSLELGLQTHIAGSAELQSTVYLFVDGSLASTERVRADGTFSFSSVTVRERGTHTLTLVAEDAAGNKSEKNTFSLVYDNPPRVTILSPKPFRGFGTKAEVVWRITDADGDSLRDFSLSYHRVGRLPIVLPISAATGTYAFDVSLLPEGDDYELMLSAGDGIASASDTVRFSIDRTPPALQSLSLDQLVLSRGEALRGQGSASDALSGVEYVEYAVSDLAETDEFFASTITSGFLQNQATYRIEHPLALQDGVYHVIARAVDAAGNVSPVLMRDVIVDTMPPRIGSFDFKTHGVRLTPDTEGVTTLYRDSVVTFEISLEDDTKTATLRVGTASVPLSRDLASGLWTGQLTVPVSETKLSLDVTDARGNSDRPLLGAIRPLAKGLVQELIEDMQVPVSEVQIEVLRLDEVTGLPAPFALSNDIHTDVHGMFELALPAGTYELIATKTGYEDVREKVVLERSSVVDSAFVLTRSRGLWGLVLHVIEYLASL